MPNTKKRATLNVKAIKSYLVDNIPIESVCRRFSIPEKTFRRSLRNFFILNHSNWPYNITNLAKGTSRSVTGYAGESLAIGRALHCGFNLFFKAWRDSPYDSVLDYSGVLYRIEIKSSTSNALGLTAGGRTGRQISRKTPSREHVLRKTDCDLIIGVNVKNGDCYVIPTEYAEIINKKSLSWLQLSPFKEKWEILKGFKISKHLSPDSICAGFSKVSKRKLLFIKKQIASCQKKKKITPIYNKQKIHSPKQSLIVTIWLNLTTLI